MESRVQEQFVGAGVRIGASEDGRSMLCDR